MTDNQTSARQQRLRAALRENLKRRKGQIRGRAAEAASTGQKAENPAEIDADQQDAGEIRPKIPERG